MEDRWFGNEFQILGATDENDLEVAKVVLRGGTHIEKDECSSLSSHPIFHLSSQDMYRREHSALP